MRDAEGSGDNKLGVNNVQEVDLHMTLWGD